MLCLNTLLCLVFNIILILCLLEQPISLHVHCCTYAQSQNMTGSKRIRIYHSVPGKRPLPGNSITSSHIMQLLSTEGKYKCKPSFSLSTYTIIIMLNNNTLLRLHSRVLKLNFVNVYHYFTTLNFLTHKFLSQNVNLVCTAAVHGARSKMAMTVTRSTFLL